METFDNILLRHNWPLRTGSDSGDVSDIETKLGFELPKDYKNFLLKYGEYETFMGEQFFRLWGKENLISMNEDIKFSKICRRQ